MFMICSIGPGGRESRGPSPARSAILKPMSALKLYDRIGTGYRDYRRQDPRIAHAITAALGDAPTVLNVGAGAGSYEPADRHVVALELSATMIRQRPRDAAPVVQASAIKLPFADKTFDAAMAVLTIHHWPNRDQGLAEMKRVSRGPCVILTWEEPTTPFWLTQDYFPEFIEDDRTRFRPWFHDPAMKCAVQIVPVPHDCSDGFRCAYWKRPEAYLDPAARQAISSFRLTMDYEPRLNQLRRDLADGTWERRNGHLLDLDEIDLGYRLVSLLP